MIQKYKFSKQFLKFITYWVNENTNQDTIVIFPVSQAYANKIEYVWSIIDCTINVIAVSRFNDFVKFK